MLPNLDSLEQELESLNRREVNQPIDRSIRVDWKLF